MSVILLSGHNFVSIGCQVKLDGETISEWDLTNWLVAEVLKEKD